MTENDVNKENLQLMFAEGDGLLSFPPPPPPPPPFNCPGPENKVYTGAPFWENAQSSIILCSN